MQAFFGSALEALLNGAFIPGSSASADNSAMSHCAAPDITARPGGRARRRRLLMAAVLLATLAWPAARAGGKDDHERARAAVLAGEVLPAQTVLERLRRSHPGQVLEIELEREDGRWIYEVKLLQADGQLLKLELDGLTADVLKLKRKTPPQEGSRP
jgi:uncharacterized membrane protein YkoI